ncbi:MAG TPA: cbb3-type cytochrome oxidase assembly protein CcoS [bacterium]|jgi:cbb3-type cytochrome oxidase maturation protein
MNIIYLLLPLALGLALVFVLFYLWAARHDQFDDLESPARRILFDDTPPPQKSTKK